MKQSGIFKVLSFLFMVLLTSNSVVYPVSAQQEDRSCRQNQAISRQTTEQGHILNGKIKIKTMSFGIPVGQIVNDDQAGGDDDKGLVLARVEKNKAERGGDVTVTLLNMKGINISLSVSANEAMKDFAGNNITDPNAGADDGKVLLSEKSFTDILEKVVNLEGIVKADKWIVKDGYVRIVAS